MFLPFPSVLVVDFGTGLDEFEPIECIHVCMISYTKTFYVRVFSLFFTGNLCDSLPDDWSALLSFGVSCSAKTYMHIINTCTVISLDALLYVISYLRFWGTLCSLLCLLKFLSLLESQTQLHNSHK